MTVKSNFSIKEIRNEVRHLIKLHSLDPQEAIYSLSQFFCPREWELIECEIENQGYCLITNSIEDLLSYRQGIKYYVSGYPWGNCFNWRSRSFTKDG